MKDNKKILVIGDAMLDRYVVGSTSRISPEAPVPILKVSEEYNTLGGAANVSHNLIKLGMANDLFAGIAKDEYGQMLRQLLLTASIGDLLQEVFATTITKTRVVSRNQQMLRVDRESDTLVAAIPESADLSAYDLVIVSDYFKGFCTQNLISNVISESANAKVKVLIDPKGKDWGKYRGAYLVKPNLTELEEVMGNAITNEDSQIVEAAMSLLEKYNIENIVVTRGDKGMTLVSKIKIKHFPARKVDVYDVSGAGDTAMAVLAMAISQGQELDDAISIANKASSFVVTKPQTYAISTEELQLLMQ